jgi:hypothetical protein
MLLEGVVQTTNPKGEMSDHSVSMEVTIDDAAIEEALRPVLAAFVYGHGIDPESNEGRLRVVRATGTARAIQKACAIVAEEAQRRAVPAKSPTAQQAVPVQWTSPETRPWQIDGGAK